MKKGICQVFEWKIRGENEEGAALFLGKNFPKTTRAKLDAGCLKLLDEFALLVGQLRRKLDIDFDI